MYTVGNCAAIWNDQEDRWPTSVLYCLDMYLHRQAKCSIITLHYIILSCSCIFPGTQNEVLHRQNEKKNVYDNNNSNYGLIASTN